MSSRGSSGYAIASRDEWSADLPERGVTRLHTLALFMCALLIGGFLYERPHQQLSYRDDEVEIQGRRCPVLSTLSAAFRCGWLVTPPGSNERVALAVIRVEESRRPTVGTLVLDGGPGQPSLLGASTYRFWLAWATRRGVT